MGSTTPSERADRRRNRARLLDAAATVLARDGADASLEEIARAAGLGSATLHRHFPSRRALVEEVFRDGVLDLAGRAERLAADHDPADALGRWLIEVTRYAVDTRGVAAALFTDHDAGPADSGDTICAHDLLRGAAQALLDRARSDVHPDAGVNDLLALANATSLAYGSDPDGAERLMVLALDGVRRPARTA